VYERSFCPGLIDPEPMALMGIDLIAYGFVMAGLGWATTWLAPGLATPAFITGLSALGAGLFWGVFALCGRHHKKGTIVTLAVISCLALSLGVSAWRLLDEENTETRLTVAVTGLMLFFSICQMIFLIRSEDKGSQK
jgi:hypothetical protein